MSQLEKAELEKDIANCLQLAKEAMRVATATREMADESIDSAEAALNAIETLADLLMHNSGEDNKDFQFKDGIVPR